MIRPLTLADTIRIAVLRGPDWAIRPTGAAIDGQRLFSPAAFLWERVRVRRRGAAWVSMKRVRTSGLVSARPRSGPTAWLVDHLVTPQRDEKPCYELLETVASYAGRHGAQRLFIHLPDEWRHVEMLRHSGFVPCTQVCLLTLPGRSPLLGVDPMRGFRPRVPSDDHSIFRLHNATTPADARSGIGVTLQQWKDAQEPPRKGTRDLVLEQEGEVKAWVRLDHYRKWATVYLTIYPDWEGDLKSLVSLALAEAGSRNIWWEVLESQGALRLLLERVGFEVAGSYRLMVKSLAVRVKEPALAAAPTSG